MSPRNENKIHFARSVALDSWLLDRLRTVEENMFVYGQVLPATEEQPRAA
jgi:hypothetical protein